MKAKITGRSELRLSDLTREYTFDILTNEDEIILSSQITRQQPSQAKQRIEEILAEYKLVYESEDDLEIDQEIV